MQRVVDPGAEPVKASTRATYMEKFGLRILEGYGVTETAPVISINTPMYNKSGTVGKIMPGMEYRLEPVEGVETGGRPRMVGLGKRWANERSTAATRAAHGNVSAH